MYGVLFESIVKRRRDTQRKRKSPCMHIRAPRMDSPPLPSAVVSLFRAAPCVSGNSKSGAPGQGLNFACPHADLRMPCTASSTPPSRRQKTSKRNRPRTGGSARVRHHRCQVRVAALRSHLDEFERRYGIYRRLAFGDQQSTHVDLGGVVSVSFHRYKATSTPPRRAKR
jgi:hypothetical protein